MRSTSPGTPASRPRKSSARPLAPPLPVNTAVVPAALRTLGQHGREGDWLYTPDAPLVLIAVLSQVANGMLLPFVLIMKEPDLGSALVILPTGLAMMFVAGTPRRYLVRLLCGVGVLGALFLVDVLFAPPNWQIKLEDYQKRRLLTYFGIDGAPGDATPQQRAEARRAQRNYSYNVEQALISVGSGGLLGKGWRQGTQNALGYLPRAVAHNDFIFSVIAEEKGFMGSVVVITLYSVVLFAGIRIAGQTRDRLGKLLAIGVVTLWFSHVFINIGMNIRIMPVTGVPLPLLSYGGTSTALSSASPRCRGPRASPRPARPSRSPCLRARPTASTSSATRSPSGARSAPSRGRAATGRSSG